MPTIINNPPQNASDSGSSAGLIIGIILAAVLVFLFFAYGLPALRERNSGTNINVPDRIDVNVSKPSN